MALRSRLWGCGLLTTALLAGCGGSGGSGSMAPANGDPDESAAPPLIAAAVTPSEAVEIDGFELVGTTRVSRTVFEYTYTAEAGNWGEADATVTATVTSTAAATTIVDGTLSFGDIPVGATVLSTDTFTLRQDRSQPFDKRALKWTVQAVPLAPTTDALIAQALADGLIDEETALLYRVFADVADDRLPVQYRGRVGEQFEATALMDAEIRFDALSPATQAIIAPFLASPDVSAVVLEPAPEDDTAALPLLAPQVSLNPPADWEGKWVVNDQVAIYWPNDVALGALYEQTANAIAVEVRRTTWPRLTSLYGRPAANRFVKIFVDPFEPDPEIRKRQTSSATSHICTTNPEVHIVEKHYGLKYVWAHELAHALLYYRFPALVGGCNQGGHGEYEYSWMHEATAKWSEHFVYPTTMGNMEHESAARFLDEPALPLEYFGDARQYGAYLWFFYITKGKSYASVQDPDVQRVIRTWEATATTSSLAAVNAGVSDLGGLKVQWPEFALYNWNRVPHTEKPYRKYFQWDKLRHRARESTTAVDPNGFQSPKVMKLDGKIYKGTPLPHLIHHLGAKYWHFDFTEDPNIRRVRLLNPYFNGPPTAKVQALINVTGKGWLPVEDWTGYERKTLCRDKEDEDVEELVIVISDSEFIDRSHVLDDSGAAGGGFSTFVEVSALGCTNWTGEVDFRATINNGGLRMTETGTATNLRWEIDVDRFSLQTFKLTRGTVNWRHVATDTREDGDVCTGDSQGSYDLAGSTTAQAFAVFSGVGDSVPPDVPLYNMLGYRFGVPGPADYVCSDAQEPFEDYTDAPAYGTHDVWLDFGFGPTGRFVNKDSPGIYEGLDPGNTLTGSSIVVDTAFLGKSRTYGWVFRKDPDPATRFEGFNKEPEL